MLWMKAKAVKSLKGNIVSAVVEVDTFLDA